MKWLWAVRQKCSISLCHLCTQSFLSYLTNVISSPHSKPKAEPHTAFPWVLEQQRPLKQICFHDWLGHLCYHAAGVQVNLVASPLTMELVQIGGRQVCNCLSHLKGIRSNPTDMLVLESRCMYVFLYICYVSLCVVMVKWKSCAICCSGLSLQVNELSMLYAPVTHRHLLSLML